jgi:hypothetical protein
VAVPVPTPSAIPFSTLTPTPPSLSAPLVPSGGVTIVEVNAYDDWVRLKNLGSSPVDLTGWALVSEYGNVTCFLSDLMLASGQELRIWARAQDAGPDDATCGLNVEMWDDDEPGPAVLYNADGRIVDSYPHE